MARSLGDKKKIGEKVTNLKQILALPTAPTDLEDYLPIESLLMNNQRGEDFEQSSTGRESSEPLPTDNKNQEEIFGELPERIAFLSWAYENETSTGVTVEKIEAAMDGCSLTAEPSGNVNWALLAIVVVSIIQKVVSQRLSIPSTQNGSKTKKAETTQNCQKTVMKMSERDKGDRKESSSREEDKDLCFRLKQEARKNLVDQNSLLKTALEEQKASIQLMFRELQSRDEHLATYEESQESVIHDISHQLRAFQKELSKRCELEQKAVSAKEQQDAKMVAGSEALQNQLETQKQEMKHVQEENQKAHERLSSQVEQLHRELEHRETTQSSSLHANQVQVEELTAKLNALGGELCNRDTRVASLEHSVETRDELQQMKILHLEEQCSSLVSQVRSLTNQLEYHREQASNTQLGLKQDATRQLEHLQTEVQICQQEYSEVMEQRCSSLEAKVQKLAHSLLDTASSEDLEMVKAQQQECISKLTGLQQRLHIQEEQSSDQYQLLSLEFRHQKELHELALDRDRETQDQLQALSREGQVQKEELRAMEDRVAVRETNFLEAISNQREKCEKFETEWFANHAKVNIKILDVEQEIELQKAEQRQHSENVEKKYFQNAAKMQQATNELESRLGNDIQSIKDEHMSTTAELKSQLTAHNLRQEQLSVSMEREKASYLVKTQNLTSEVRGCREKLCHLEANCDQNQLGLSALQSEFQMQGNDREEAEKRVAVFSSTVQALASELSHRSKQLDILQEGQSDIENRFSDLEGLKKELRNRERLQENIQSYCTGLSLTVKGIEDRIESQERRFSQYEDSNQSKDVERDLKIVTLGEKLQQNECMLQRNASKIDFRCAALEALAQELQSELTKQWGEIELARESVEATERELALQKESLENMIEEDKVPMIEQMDEKEKKDNRSIAKQLLLRVEDYLDKRSGSASNLSASVILLQNTDQKPDVATTFEPVLSSLSTNGQEAEVNTAQIVRSYGSIGAIQELRKSLADKEEEFVCVATRLAAFKTELRRRCNNVTNFEAFAKKKRDALCSKVDFLRNEISLQRELLKRWERTTHKNRCDLNEMQCQYEFLQAEEEHARRELQASIKKKADLETSLKEEGISDSLAACLRNNLRYQEKQCDEWTYKMPQTERLLESCEKECSNVAARLELFIDDLGRREERVCGLEQNLKVAVELGIIEESHFEAELSQLRGDRDIWTEKTDEMSHLLRKTEKEYTDLQDRLREHQEDQQIALQSVPGTRHRVKERLPPFCLSDELSALQQVSVGIVDQLPTRSQISCESLFFAKLESLKSQLEERQELEERQKMTFAKTREALEAQLEHSKEQCQKLAETMAKVTDDINSREFLGEKVESLQSELLSRKNQLSCLEDEQLRLKRDFDAQIEMIRREIGAQEELQRVVQENEQGKSGSRHGLSALSTKLESLATRFVDRGDLVAKVGVLSDGLRKCEDQLASFEQEQDDTKKDISGMIDFFRSDLQVQKQLLQEHLDSVVGADFSALLQKVKELTQSSVCQKSQFLDIEKALKTNEEFCVKLENEMQEQSLQVRIQLKHVLQELNENFVDLATKLELLTNEFKARGEQSVGLEKKVRERQTLYLTQMDSIRGNLEERQLQHQQQIQVRIYDVMMQVASVLAKQKSCPATPNASERALVTQAVRRQSAAMITQGNRDKEAKQVEAAKNSPEQRNAPLAGSSFAIGARPGYSMVSGIIMKNQFVPAMLGAFTSLRGAQNSIDN